MCSLKNIEKIMVLLCFRSKVLKKHWFYCVFAQKGWTTIGFIVKEQKSEKKPLVLPWKIVKKSNFAYKTNAFLKKRVVKQIPAYGFGPWSCNSRLEKLWGTLTDKLFREPLVLLCFRSNMLKKPLVLLCFRSKNAKNWKNHWFYYEKF